MRAEGNLFFNNLLNRYLSATDGFASESANLALDKLNHAILSGVNGEVATGIGTWASNLSGANLADDHFTCINLLATKALNA